MLKFVRLVLVLTCFAAHPAIAQPLRVMSFNVRYPSFGDEADNWASREPILIDTIRAADADVIGTQELFALQGDAIVRALPAYRWFGRDRRGLHSDEHMGILWRSDRLRLIRQGDFWLSTTPDVAGSSSWGVNLPRMVTWGEFETRNAARTRFVLFNTHFAHRAEDDAARTCSARLLLARMPMIAGKLPAIVTGDLNALPTTDAYRAMAGGMTDAWTAAAARIGPAMTYHDFTGVADRRIDYIFVRDFTSVTARVPTDHRGGHYPSDHFPVVADLNPAETTVPARPNPHGQGCAGD
ncbi:endonuclease/exonuclease/phosphatase family protein [Sphingomonas sp. 37zxx]|uniref:endonuclease/exonuclease/phosphatase family protein n=1 Tax=Sphingomonas sp. 37zxx TaxID=1550073 RepID=UPI00068F38FF|nr:endonuclease/exonuclease/phosphatase family protein [Sphingomonas sp. 37zxx]